MEIQRYLNGKPVSEGELAQLAAVTPELTSALREANRRVVSENSPAGVLHQTVVASKSDG